MSLARRVDAGDQRMAVATGGSATTIDIETFKAGMRRLAAGVSLITTQTADGTRTGMTATAVCSVAAEPPTLLCCINRNNASFDAVRGAGVFAVNALAVDDRSLADHFARRISSEEKFAAGLWTTLATKAPILESALVAFDCRLTHMTEVGTHGIMFGEIVSLRLRRRDVRPLLYAQGSYGSFAANGAGVDPGMLWVPGWGHDE